ncbi:MAG: hypothetical protein BWY74_01087 [Firmicutes bacterium ADurb.Bin419]|nr:MAG: hypothetical protein BWY74_01087 [Firmicutes bacterium ADurb.Bin419]
MRNKTITYSLIGLILLIFIAYFTAQNTIFLSGQPIANELSNIIQYAKQDKWAEAEDSVNKLVKDWDKVKYLLAFNYAEADYSLFLDNLSRIQGAIKTKDDTETVTQALSTLELWRNFTKIVPQP